MDYSAFGPVTPENNPFNGLKIKSLPDGASQSLIHPSSIDSFRDTLAMAPQAFALQSPLLVNGGFNDGNLSGTGFYPPSVIPGWDTPTGAPLQLWQSSINPSNYFLNLDSTATVEDRVFQDITTKANSRYVLSFDLARRPGPSPFTSDVVVLWDDEVVGRFQALNKWQKVAVELVSPGAQMTRLEIRELAEPGFPSGDGAGILLDNVALEQTSNYHLENGSFEVFNSPNSNKQFYASAIPGWNASGSWQQQLVAIPRLSDATNGDRAWHLDYSAERLDKLWQDIRVSTGESYLLTFDMKGQTDSDDLSNQLRIRWNNEYRATFRGGERWNRFGVVLSADTTGLSRLEFREPPHGATGKGDGIGMFLDNIRLHKISNALVSNSGDSILLSEKPIQATETIVPVALGSTADKSRLLRFRLDASLANQSTAEVQQDLFNVYLVDQSRRNIELLGNGTHDSPIFSINSAGKTTFAPGLVSYDGYFVEIDTSSIDHISNGQLLFQLINGNNKTGSNVEIRDIVSKLVDRREPIQPIFRQESLSTPAESVIVSGLTDNSDVEVLLDNIRFEAVSGKYFADMRLKNNGSNIGRNTIVLFDALPQGVSVVNQSGTDSSGRPYINFKNAIRSGGLTQSSISESISVEVDNPKRVAGLLKTIVKSGAANSAPVLNDTNPIVVMPGHHVDVQLIATDPDGDPLNFSMDLKNQLPSGMLTASGRLQLSPIPAELGSYQFEVVVSDGVLNSRKSIQVNVVPDPVTTTRLSGVLLDTDQSPLANVRVSLNGIDAFTDSTGSFELVVPGLAAGDAILIHGEEITSANTYPFIAEKVELLLERNPFSSINNVIKRPIYLPALDMENAMPIDPNQNTTVTTNRIAGASVFVAAGTLQNQNGGLFSGNMGITEVPVAVTPAALPVNLMPDLVVTIQPGEMVFTQPAPLSLPNRSGYAPGVELDLWSINPVTGQFDAVGIGRVSVDGTVIETISGGIRNSSWHFFAPNIADGYASSGPDGCNSCKASGPLGSDVTLYSGEFHETHATPTYQSLGQNRGVVLQYHSNWADPRPIVRFGYDDLPSWLSDRPDIRFFSRLQVENGAFGFEVVGDANGSGRHYWSIPGTQGRVEAALQADLSEQNSGIYQYLIDTGFEIVNGSGASNRYTGEIIHVNEIDGPFGAGWSFDGWQKIIENGSSNAVLLVDGNGTKLRFEQSTSNPNEFISPVGDFSTLRKVSGHFERTLKNQTRYTFNSDNLIERVVDRNNNVTTFGYQNQKLTAIVDPVGLRTTFEYSGNRVARIIDPANRITQLEYDSQGNLARITDPDGTSRQFGYDAEHHLIRDVDKRGNTEQIEYGFHGRAVRSIRNDGTTRIVSAYETQGLYSGALTQYRDTAPPAVLAGSVIAGFVDGRGNLDSTLLDRLGQATSTFDSFGREATFVRNGENLVVRSIDARGNITSFKYDERGNIIEISDSIINSGGYPENAIFWIGNETGDWNDPNNWSSGLVPTRDDFVVFDTPDLLQNIVISGGSFEVGNFVSVENVTITNATLSVFGDSHVENEFTISIGATLVVQGAGTEFIANGSVEFDGANIFVNSGASVDLSNATSYTQATVGEFQTATIRVQGSGSHLNLSNVTSITGASRANDDIVIEALAGGTIDLSSVTGIVDGGGSGGQQGGRSISVSASGTGSLVNLSAMTTFTDALTDEYSILKAINGGTVLTPLLVDLQGIWLQHDGTGTIPISQIVSFNNGKASLSGTSKVFTNLVNGGGTDFIVSGVFADLSQMTTVAFGGIELSGGATVDVSNVSNIDSANLIVSGGVTLSLPSATSYTHATVGEFQTATIRVQGSDSHLDLSNVTSITGASRANDDIVIEALAGGTIDLSSVTEIVDGGGSGGQQGGRSISVSASGTGSLVNLSVMTTFADTLTDEYSVLKAINGGSVLTPLLVDLQGIWLQDDGTGTIPISQIVNFVNGRASLSGTTKVFNSLVNGGGTDFVVSGVFADLSQMTTVAFGGLELSGGATVDVSNVTNIDTANLIVSGGVTLSLPSATSYTHATVGEFQTATIRVQGSGSHLDLTNVTSITGASRANDDIVIEALAGGTIDLSSVTEIVDGGGSGGQQGGRSISVSASGTGSLVSLSAMTTFTDALTDEYSVLKAINGGTVLIPLLVDLQGIWLQDDGTGTIPISQIVNFNNGKASLSGTSKVFTNLVNGGGTDFIVSGIFADLSQMTTVAFGGLELSGGATVDVSNVTNIDTANLIVSGGVTLSLPSATSYTHATVGEFQTATIRVQGSGSHLDLTNVTSITGASRANDDIVIEALAGGTIDLSRVTEIIDGGGSGGQQGGRSISASASGSGSLVNLSAMTTFADTLTDEYSVLKAINGGSVLTPLLVDLQGIWLQHDGTGTIPISQIVNFVNGRASLSGTTKVFNSLVNGGGTDFVVSGIFADLSQMTTVAFGGIELSGGATVDVSNVSNIDSANLIVSGGVTLSLPSATSYTHATVGEFQTATIRVQGSGSHLDLSNVTSITGASRANDDILIEALAGGTIDLSKVTGIVDGGGSGGQLGGRSINVSASGTGSLVNLSSMTTFTDALTDEYSVLKATDNGIVDASVLTDMQGVLVIEETGGDVILPSSLRMTISPQASTGSNSIQQPASKPNPQTPQPPENSFSSAPQFSAAITQPKKFTYDTLFNQLTSFTDELGRKTIYEIDPTNGNRLATIQVIGLLDSTSSETDDIITRYTYTAQGLVDLITDPLGRVTDYDYDIIGRLSNITFAVGTSDQAFQSFGYDLIGNLTQFTDANGNLTRYEYDVMNRLKTVIEADPDGDGPRTFPITRYTYDENGNNITVRDARGNTTTNMFDSMDRLISTSDPLGRKTYFMYDPAGNITGIIDPLGNMTRSVYDNRDRVVRTIDANDGSTSFEYDKDNNLIGLTDPAGNRTQFTFDARSRMTGEIDPLGKSIAYEYNAVDDLIKKTDRNGRITEFVFDEVHRLTSETWLSAGMTVENQVTSVYDKASNLLSIADNFSALTMTYDARNRVLSVDNSGTPNVPSVIVNYSYDDEGNVLSVRDSFDGSEQGITDYVYDPRNLVSRISQSGLSIDDKRVDFTYSNTGQFTSITRFSDLAGLDSVVTTNYQYDQLDRVTRINHTNSTQSIAFYDYLYDAASRISSITNIDGQVSYTYDKTNQLTGANYSSSSLTDEFYSYDENGNRISSHLHGNGYVTGPANRLLSDGTFNYQFDEEGNMVKRIEIATGAYREMVFDHRNRLTKVTDFDSTGTPTQLVEFSYDALGRRISKSVDTTPTDGIDGTDLYFIYDREDVILDFLDADGNGSAVATVDQRYLHGPRIDQVLAQDSLTGSEEWLLSDHLGSVRATANEFGQLATEVVFDSFGNGETPNDYRFAFTGREIDVETGLYHFRTRSYDNTIARFVTQDLLRHSQRDHTLYNYVNNAPIQNADPFGTAPANVIVKAIRKTVNIAKEVVCGLLDIPCSPEDLIPLPQPVEDLLCYFSLVPGPCAKVDPAYIPAPEPIPEANGGMCIQLERPPPEIRNPTPR